MPHGGFTFGASDDVNMPDSLLATQGMDDTCMDLSQFDDGPGQSGPATPRTQSPPTISITEAPAVEGEEGIEEIVPLEAHDVESQDSQVPQQQEETAGEEQGYGNFVEISQILLLILILLK